MSASFRILEAELHQATAVDNEMPLVILMAASRDGRFQYTNKFGRTGPDPRAPLATEDTMIRLASATKLPTSVAAMQMVERGLVELDQDIGSILPEWKNPQFIEGFDQGGQPILRDARGVMTLRKLLSHTAGLPDYESKVAIKYYLDTTNSWEWMAKHVFSDDGDADPVAKKAALEEYQARRGVLIVTPLTSEPGTRWDYGHGIDWAGRIIERVSGMSLEQYCKINIFEPLAMHHTTFRPLDQTYGTSLLAEMSSFGADGKIQPGFSLFSLDPKEDMGGHGLFSTSSDVMKLLLSLLRNDGKLLRPETVDMMLDYRLPETGELAAFKATSTEKEDCFGDMAPADMRIDHSLAGLVNLGDLKGGRKAGSVTWLGATGCAWWIDRTADVCGFYGSQSLFLHDKQGKHFQYIHKFERAVYEALEEDAAK